jgi:hypothetical protein
MVNCAANDPNCVPAERFPSGAGERRYRLRKYYLIVGVIGTVFFLTMDAVSLAVACSAKRPVLAALILCGLWSGFTLLGIWLIWAYFRECLCLSDSTVTAVGCIREKKVQVADVIKVVWRTVPQGGSIVVRTPATKFKVYLDNFTVEERDELIAYFRGRFDTSRQDGWPRFVEQFLAGRFLDRNPEHRRRTKISRMVAAMSLLVAAGYYGYLCADGRNFGAFVMSVILAGTALRMIWGSLAGPRRFFGESPPQLTDDAHADRNNETKQERGE